MITAVTGINWGDEGKGRIVDLLSEKADYVVRYQGGNNAGHTVVTPEGKYVLNLIPSGILHPEAVCVLGGGMVVDLDHLRHEMSMLQYMKVKVDSDNLRISDKATICMPFHVRQDVLEEERLLEKGRYTEARIYIEQALRNKGDKSRTIVEHAGDIYYMSGEKGKALEYWKKADAMDETPEDGSTPPTEKEKKRLKQKIAQKSR